LFNINQFRSTLRYGGARTSNFSVNITNPSDGSADAILPFRAKATNFAESTMNMIEVFHMGRSIKVPGNRTFSEWSVTIMEDEDFKIRNALESWSNDMNGFESNIRRLGSDMNAYKSIAEVTQYSQTGQPLRSYRMIGIFPLSISPLQGQWENETIHEYEVTFSYDYWVIGNATTGDAGGI
jgi:hypothetical protein